MTFSQSLRQFLLVCCVLALTVICANAQSGNPIAKGDVEKYLQRKLAENPHDASAWRLLAKYYRRQGDDQQALDALEKSIGFDSKNAVTHFDLAELHADRRNFLQAEQHFHRVIELSPESDYARQSRSFLGLKEEPSGSTEIQPVGFEVSSLRGSQTPFQRSNPFDERIRRANSPTDDYFVFVETGVLYNSNVALSPISRELAPQDSASAQFFVAPSLEWTAIRNGNVSAGLKMDGNFNLNDANFREFNLQSYRPGWFVEKSIELEQFQLIPRFDYDFTHDEFQGETFGNRHELTISSTLLWNEGDSSYLYWTLDNTKFSSQGSVPGSLPATVGRIPLE